MDLSYSEEQRLLQESVNKFIQQEYDFETRRKIADSNLGYSEKNWQTFADLGWLAVPFSETVGGLAGGPVEIMILMEAFGKGLVVEPWVATVLMAGHLVEVLADDEQQQRYLSAIIQGESQCSLAHWEVAQGIDRVTTIAELKGDTYVINGNKAFVFNGQNADRLLVSARINDEPDAIALFDIEATQPGIEITPFKTLEGGRAAHIKFSNVVSTQKLAEGKAVVQALQSCQSLATFAICAEAVGMMEVLYKTTVEYAKTRQQFGVPIGKFQALQHRMVDMFMLHEQSYSLMLMTAIKLQEGGEEADHAVAALKAWIGQAGRKLGQEAIQMHGGMGMTDELNVGYYFKRLTAIDALFGNADYYLDKYAKGLR